MSTTLVLGGVRSGKSRHAEALLATHQAVTYVATGPVPPGMDATGEDRIPTTQAGAADLEWAQRVAAHQARRPSSWTTVETSDLAGAITAARGAVLIDCLGTWVTAAIDAVDGWQDPERAWRHLDPLVDELLAAWSASAGDLVAVTNEVGMGVVPATASGRLFRDVLGRVNARVSAASDRVHLVIAGRVIDLSGCPVVA